MYANKNDNRRALYLVIADDEPDTVATLATILVDEGNEVLQANKGARVINGARLRRPDALILDIDLPGMSGYTVAREIRNLYESSPPLMIAISGKWVGQTDKMLADLAGFNHFLQKPCDPGVVIQLLEPLRRDRPSASPLPNPPAI
jgi:DNA-binding response OmpR family regulator